MLIPALDLIDGNIVRLQQGDFDRKTVFNLDPTEKVREYAADGAAMIHIVDLDGAKDPTKRQIDLIKRMTEASSCPVQTGGGIRSFEDAEKLLQAGVYRVVAGSAAVKDPALGIKMLQELGSEHVCIALDVRMSGERAEVAIHGWLEGSGKTAEEMLDLFTAHGLKHTLITDISKDGMMKGTNTDLYRRLSAAYPDLDITASGGISSLEDIKKTRESGAKSCVLGRALLTGAFSLKEALACWPNE